MVAYRKDVMQKQGFSTMKEYFRFARSVGQKIDFNKRMKKLAAYYGVSVYHLGQRVAQCLAAAPDQEDPVQMIRDYLLFLDLSERTGGSPRDRDLSLQGIIAQHIRPTPKRSFCRYGDRNCLTPAISRHYISDADGTPLDTQAQNLTISFGKEITPDDLIDFMLTYENPKTYKSKVEQEMETLSIAFKSLTGMTLNEDFALRFEQEFMRVGTVRSRPDNTAAKAPF